MLYITQIIIDTVIDIQLDTIYNTEYITQIVVDTIIEDGKGIIKLDVALENDRGEKPLQGTAVVELPVK